MANVNLKFGPDLAKDISAFRLLELSPELCKLIESSTPDTMLTIRGEPDEDAVLCTPDKTYSLRSVVLSNSVLVVTPTSNPEDVIIRGQLHEVLEPVPCIPKLQKLGSLLRGREYDEGHEEDEETSDGEDGRPSKKRRFTYDDARQMLQASDYELERGLKDRRVLVLNGHLRLIAPSHLSTILELLLTGLVSLSLSHSAAPVEDLVSTLQDEHDINREVTKQVMRWFGKVEDGRWEMDVEATVKEVGVGILRAYRHEPIPETQFIGKWKTAVGDTFESKVDLKLLSGTYLSRPIELSNPPAFELTYFPSSALPSDPAARFADLFLTRPRWKAEDIAPFLEDIVVDNKDRDRLLLKYARAITDKEGVWYTTRIKT